MFDLTKGAVYYSMFHFKSIQNNVDFGLYFIFTAVNILTET